MRCPKCIGKLETLDIGGVEVDKCFICNGLWFDGGELWFMRNNRKSIVLSIFGFFKRMFFRR